MHGTHDDIGRERRMWDKHRTEPERILYFIETANESKSTILFLLIISLPMKELITFRQIVVSFRSR